MFTMGSNSEMSDMDGSAAGAEEREREPVRSSSQLHACKATTSLSQLGRPSHCSVAEDAAADAPPPRLSHVASDPAVATGAPDEPLRSRARSAAPRDCPARPRKRLSARRLHSKKLTPLRTRVRAGTAYRGMPEGGAAGDGSYVDYSGSDAVASDTADAPQPSARSSTATLGTADQGEDTATTTSVDSPGLEATQTSDVPADNIPADLPATDEHRVPEEQPPQQQQHQHQAQPPPPPQQQQQRQQQQLRQRQSPQTQQPQRQPSSQPEEQPALAVQTTYKSKVVKRSMESQRQQSIVEQEEEDMARASAQLTGIKHRTNHAAGMAPHVFMAPDSLAYRSQIRQADRAYAHVRSMAQPLVASIARCVELRENRQAAAAIVPRDRARALRRPLVPDMHSPGAGTDWWTSLMPPPRPDSRSQPPGYQRLQHADLPQWARAPHPDRGLHGAAHEADDDVCPHIRELRTRATELGIVHQQGLHAGRTGAPPPMRLHATAAATTAAFETWRGRRIPGLLSVDVYAGNVTPRAAAPRSLPTSEAGIIGSPSSDSGLALRPSQPVPPYRRNGTVYGQAPTNATNTTAVSALAAAIAANTGTGAAAAAGGPGGAQRRHESIATSRPHTASIHENDPRRTSYFDRLSMDEDRPRASASSVHQTSLGLFRRVISGLTGGTAALGSSQ
ncbi:hypothetical protein H4R19_004048 [Coemansia spiralis]|nr:hypothetical protein H4R19_004048 [Coemansia spiralis]